MALDINKEIAAIQEMYGKSVLIHTFNALVYGGIGSGKTHLLQTARRPILIDSFDPGGTKTILNTCRGIQEGWIIVDNRWEDETPRAPKKYMEWEKEHFRRKAEGFYALFGTYAMDSLTTFASLAMYEILKRKGRPAGVPQQDDYLPQMTLLENAIKEFIALPCDCILTAHPDADKDEVTGRMFIGPMVTGKLKVRLPLLFDEIYCAESKETGPNKTEYSLITKPTGLYTARTRIGAGGKFDLREKPDIKYLLKKAGYPADDKPIPWLEAK